MKETSLSNIFGKPFEGIHKYRLGHVAIVDLLMTFVLAYVTTLATDIPLNLTIVFWILFAILIHFAFGVRTEVINYLL